MTAYGGSPAEAADGTSTASTERRSRSCTNSGADTGPATGLTLEEIGAELTKHWIRDRPLSG